LKQSVKQPTHETYSVTHMNNEFNALSLAILCVLVVMTLKSFVPAM